MIYNWKKKRFGRVVFRKVEKNARETVERRGNVNVRCLDEALSVGERTSIVSLAVCIYIYNRKLLKKLRYTVAKSAVQARDGLSTTLWHVRRANTLDATIFKYC